LLKKTTYLIINLAIYFTDTTHLGCFHGCIPNYVELCVLICSLYTVLVRVRQISTSVCTVHI